MEFGTMDLFDSEEESEPVVDKALVDRLSYTPRMCSTDLASTESPQDDDNGRKMLADRYYLNRDFPLALRLYSSLLSGPGCRASLALTRDITECVARSCLALGDTAAARQHALAFHSSSPHHPDHQMVGLALLIDISRAELAAALPSPALELAQLVLLCRVLELQPSLPLYWQWLGDLYRTRQRPSVTKQLACLLRARDLLQTVLATSTITTFITERNTARVVELELRVQELGQSQEEVERVRARVCRDLRGGRGAKSEADTKDNGDFEDLGASVRLKKMEEVLGETSDTGSEATDDEALIERFEQKWFN